MKTICLVAHDAAPSRCFAVLQPALENVGYTVLTFLGHGKPLTNEQFPDQVQKSDFVLLGMSSSLSFAKAEIAAGEVARNAGIPYGFYGDIMGCWRRAREGAWFSELGKSASLYLGFDARDAEDARAVFPNARCMGTGNPLRESMAFPTRTRDQVRSVLRFGDKEKVILAPGDKNVPGNLALWGLLVEACCRLAEKHFIRLVVTPHPGDVMLRATEPGSDKLLNPYGELTRLSPVPVYVLKPGEMSSSEALPGVDLVVEFSTSVGIEAAYQRIPVITVPFEIHLRAIELERGDRWVENAATGAALRTGPSVLELAHLMECLLDKESAESHLLRKRQEEAYPVPLRRGATLEGMVQTMQNILG